MSALDLISLTTVSSPTTALSLSVGSDHAHILIKGAAQSTHTNSWDYMYMRLNGWSTSYGVGMYHEGYNRNGSGTSSTNTTTNDTTSIRVGEMNANNYSTAFSPFEIWIPDYRSSNKWTSILAAGGGPNVWLDSCGSLKSTSAISSVQLYMTSASFEVGSTVAVYGLGAE